MTSVKECEEFLSYYWSDLNSAAAQTNDGGTSTGIEQSGEIPREKAERLRKIIRFLSRMKSRCCTLGREIFLTVSGFLTL